MLKQSWKKYQRESCVPPSLLSSLSSLSLSLLSFSSFLFLFFLFSVLFPTVQRVCLVFVVVVLAVFFSCFYCHDYCHVFCLHCNFSVFSLTFSNSPEGLIDQRESCVAGTRDFPGYILVLSSAVNPINQSNQWKYLSE